MKVMYMVMSCILKVEDSSKQQNLNTLRTIFFSSNKKFRSLDIKGCITGKNNLLAEAAFKILYQSMERNTGFYWLNFFHAIFSSSKGQKVLTSWLVMSFLTIVTLFLLPLF